MATTGSLVRLGTARAVNRNASALTTDQAMVLAEGAMDREEQTFRAIVFAVAQRMNAARTERNTKASGQLWADAVARKWLGEGWSSDPRNLDLWVDRLNGFYQLVTETSVSGTRASSTFKAVRGVGDKNTTRVLYFGLQKRVTNARTRRDTSILADYDNARVAGRNAGIEVVGGARKSIAGDAPHWIVVYDALNFTTPDTLNLTLGEVRRQQSAATGAAFGASSGKAQAWAAAVGAAGAAVQDRLKAAGAGGFTPDHPASTTPTGADTASSIPWTLLIILAVVALAVWYFAIRKGA